MLYNTTQWEEQWCVCLCVYVHVCVCLLLIFPISLPESLCFLVFQKDLILILLHYNKLWKILKEMGIPDP